MSSEFIIAGVSWKDDAWHALGTYDGRFLDLPISEDEYAVIAPNLSDDRTYRFAVDAQRMEDDASVLVTR